MRIDTHNHTLSPRVLSLIQSNPMYDVHIAGREFKGGADYTEFTLTDEWLEPSAKLRELDDKGLDVAVMCVPKPVCYWNLDPDAGEHAARETNIGLAEFCSYDPKRLKWLAQLPLQAPERSSAVLRDAVRLGCSGVHAGTSIVGRRLDEPEFEPFWSAVEAADMTVFVHPMFAAEFGVVRSARPAPSGAVAGKWPQWKVMTGLVGFPMEVTLMAERLMVSGVLANHPRARVHLALGGGFLPYQLGRLRMFKEKGDYPELRDSPAEPLSFIGQITIDTHVTDVRALRFLIDRIGLENAALGTDAPFNVSNQDPIAELKLAADNDENIVRQVAEVNPARLFHVS